MKVKNKKTGEIGELKPFVIDEKIAVWIDNKSYPEYRYNSLAELNEEWCDYEEPKEYWYIDYDGGILCGESDNSFAEKMMISMGNHFESLEEAEKAVEKLKAWKRLKDKGFKFTGINGDEDSQELITQCGILCEADIYHLEKDADFLLIFGSEE